MSTTRGGSLARSWSEINEIGCVGGRAGGREEDVFQFSCLTTDLSTPFSASEVSHLVAREGLLPRGFERSVGITFVQMTKDDGREADDSLKRGVQERKDWW
jgi:hypothetical protein